LSRNNEDRLGAAMPAADSPASVMASDEAGASNAPLTFSTPTEFVELPSQGRYYPENHPLHKTETLEIRYMTAKDEDILSSKSLLKKGLAIDRFLNNVIVDKKVKIDDLLVGDKNAVLVASRITGYGEIYSTNVVCPACATNQTFDFDLGETNINYADDLAELNVELTQNNTFIVYLPRTKVNVEVRMLTGADEKKLTKIMEHKKKHKLPETTSTDQMRMYIISVNGHEDKQTIESLIQNLPAADARHLRDLYGKATPNVDLKHHFDCETCGYAQLMEVPFTADFFWPKQ